MAELLAVSPPSSALLEVCLKGNITVTEGALAAIVALAAHEVPGVVGMRDRKSVV